MRETEDEGDSLIYAAKSNSNHLLNKIQGIWCMQYHTAHSSPAVQCLHCSNASKGTELGPLWSERSCTCRLCWWFPWARGASSVHQPWPFHFRERWSGFCLLLTKYSHQAYQGNQGKSKGLPSSKNSQTGCVTLPPYPCCQHMDAQVPTHQCETGCCGREADSRRRAW